MSSSDRATILFYSGAIIVTLHFVNLSSGVQVIPLSFVLKNKLHLSATELAFFSLWAGIPAYLSFAFGMVRDFWSPFRLGDRGYFILFGGVAAAVFASFAFLDVTVPMLFVSILLISICFLFMWSASTALRPL